MKKVILEVKSSEVYLDDLNDENFIGMQTLHGSKFILSARSDGYEFIGEKNLISRGKSSYRNFNEAIAGCHSLFVFESAKELFKWMSE